MLLPCLLLSSNSKHSYHHRTFSLFDRFGIFDTVITDSYRARFKNVARLYKGEESLALLSRSHCCVVGLGGVGSWTCEALARSGIGELTLIDVDDICISNTNRQLQALSSSVGKFKADVLRNRILDINPEAIVHTRLEFLTGDNVDQTIFYNASTETAAPAGVFGCFDFVVDATDGVSDKAAIIDACVRSSTPVVVCGGAGDIIDPTLVRISDMTQVLGDGLVLYVRKKLRQKYGYPKGEQMKAGKKMDKPWNIPVVHAKFIPLGAAGAGNDEELNSSPSAAVSCSPDSQGEINNGGTSGSFRACDVSLGNACFATGTVGFALASVVVSAIATGSCAPPIALGHVGETRPVRLGRFVGVELSKGIQGLELAPTGVTKLAPTMKEYDRSSSNDSNVIETNDGDDDEGCACGKRPYDPNVTMCSSISMSSLPRDAPSTAPAQVTQTSSFEAITAAAIGAAKNENPQYCLPGSNITASSSSSGRAESSAYGAVDPMWLRHSGTELIDAHCHLQLDPLFASMLLAVSLPQTQKNKNKNKEDIDKAMTVETRVADRTTMMSYSQPQDPQPQASTQMSHPASTSPCASSNSSTSGCVSTSESATVVDRALAVGVRGAAVCGTCPGEDWERVALLYSAFPDFIRPQFGLHPWWIRRYLMSMMSDENDAFMLGSSGTKSSGTTSSGTTSSGTTSSGTTSSGTTSSGTKSDDEAEEKRVGSISVGDGVSEGRSRCESITQGANIVDCDSTTNSLDSMLPNLLTLRSQLIEVLTRFPRAGVGECGLDRLIATPAAASRKRDQDNSKKGESGADDNTDSTELYFMPMHRQVEIVRLHVRVASEFQRPLTLHCVQCWGTLFDILAHEAATNANKLPRVIVLHSCNAMPLEMIPRFKKLSLATGVRIFYSLSIKVCGPKEVNIARNVPRNRLVIETDSPDQFPRELSGAGTNLKTSCKCNEPALLPFGVGRLAEALGVDFDLFAASVASNTREAYDAV